MKEQVSKNQEVTIQQLRRKRANIANSSMVNKYQKNKPETRQ